MLINCFWPCRECVRHIVFVQNGMLKRTPAHASYIHKHAIVDSSGSWMRFKRLFTYRSKKTFHSFFFPRLHVYDLYMYKDCPLIGWITVIVWSTTAPGDKIYCKYSILLLLLGSVALKWLRMDALPLHQQLSAISTCITLHLGWQEKECKMFTFALRNSGLEIEFYNQEKFHWKWQKCSWNVPHLMEHFIFHLENICTCTPKHSCIFYWILN